MDIHALLQTYPRKRGALPEAYHRVYEDAYVNSREGQTIFTRISLWLEQWMHWQAIRAPQTAPLLEIGAGTLNHVPYEDGTAPYDIVEPFERLYAGKPELQKIRTVYADTADIPPGPHYSRIVSIAVFEHIPDLPEVIAHTTRILQPTGVLRTGIPSEGGFLWYLAWRFGTGLGFWLKYRLSYKPFQKHEHINTAAEIEAVIKHHYRTVTIQRFPLNHRHLSFYTFVEARDPIPQP